MFDWSDLRVFLAIQRTGSLSAAARTLRVNQTTVGRRLAELEQALGARLFDRLPAGMVLTGAGEELLPHALGVEERALAVERAVSARDSAPSGVVRLTCVESLGSRFLAPRLGELHSRHPGLRLEVLTGSHVLDLTRRESDLALRLGKPVEPGLASRKLGRMGFALYGTRALLGARPPVHVEDARGIPLLAFDESLAHLPESRWLAKVMGEAVPVLRSNSTSVLFEAALAGLGLAVLPCWLAEGSGLMRVGAAGEGVEREMWLAVHPDLRRVARIRAVADFLAGLIAREGPRLAGASA
ncbi:LysR family transcriptional regulator [Pyxidicoccus parkwayensis]|uniref:LysR family transcriptional regulator n=1 Tax=Pyxidicoccus parkwayensis TaxID=2813578 RepID=A0ABX7NIS6_9BACT|nr:LysR family transcriptional regulator [Pyxidicoccus parkwaysis]QSQ18762.1 LysR family transcriptional regulator [Pyxidicoccus parkwaysis]